MTYTIKFVKFKLGAPFQKNLGCFITFSALIIESWDTESNAYESRRDL